MQHSQDATSEQTSFIQSIYIKNVSIETVNTPQIFNQPWQPEVQLALDIASERLEPRIYELTLSLTVTMNREGERALSIELQQAAIFNLQAYREEDLHALLGSQCPNILFPYARETISDLLLLTEFPRIYLAPINFDAFYQQEMRKRELTATTGN